MVPALLALLASAPQFIAVRDPSAWMTVRTSCAGLLLLIVGTLGAKLEWQLHLFEASLSVTPFRLDGLFAALVFALLRLREGRAACLDWAFLFLLVAAMAPDAHKLSLFLNTPSPANVLAVLLLGGAWCLVRFSFASALAFFSVGLWLDLRVLVLDGALWEWPFEFCRWWTLGALALGLAFDHGPKPLPRLLVPLLVAVWSMGVWSCQPASDLRLAYFYAVALVLLAACMRNWLLYGGVLLAYLAAANLLVFSGTQPSSAASWGWLAIVFAFGLFGAAFRITRAHLASQPANRA